MSEIHDIERLIRKVTRHASPARDSERLVVVDVRRGRAVDKVGILDFMREFKYYIVSNSEDPSNTAYGEVCVPYKPRPEQDVHLSIKVNYKAWCPPGREKQLAEALHHGSDPGETLNGLMSRWALEKIGSANGALSGSSSESESFIEAELRNKAQIETGLGMDVDFAVTWPNPASFKITDTLAVRAKDYFREESLTLRVDVVNQPQFSRIPYTETDLKELIRTSVQDYFSHNVTLQALYFNLNTYDFNELLIRYLNERSKTTGYRIECISLERADSDQNELNEWLIGIQVEITDSEGEFETAIPRVFVDLSADLTVHLKDIWGVKTMVERQQPVPLRMKREVIKAIRQFVRNTHPADIYTQFVRLSTQNKSAFENRLMAKLSEVLAGLFHADISTATLKMGETEVTKTLTELQKERCEFKVLIPRNRRNAEDYLFTGYFKIDEIDRNGWGEFQRVLPNITQVKERLQGAIKAALENDPNALINLTQTLDLQSVKSTAERAAANAVLNDFGLRVRVTDIGSDDLVSEKSIAESVIKARAEIVTREVNRYFSVSAFVTEEIKKLELDLVSIKASGGDDQAIQEIQKRINSLKDYSPTQPTISDLYYEEIRGTGSSSSTQSAS